MAVLVSLLMALHLHSSAALPSAPYVNAKRDGPSLASYVDVFLGTEGGGNMFPGVVPEPFSVVKLGPDVVSGTTDAYSGYLPTGNITGFSMMHESGTGGAPKYGVVSQMPVAGDVANPLANISSSRRAPDSGSVGYYKSQLSDGTIVELGGTSHAALYQYTFPVKHNMTSVVVDVSHYLTSYRGLGWEQHYSGGNFSVLPDGHYEGSGTYNNGWNLSPDWTVFFCGHFDQPVAKWRTFIGNGTVLTSYDTTSGTGAGPERKGGVFQFATSNVTSRVGLSFISAAQACSNVNREVPRGTQLPDVVSASAVKWTDQVLSKVQSSSTNATMLGQLYSYLYGMHLIPSNRTGENPLWNSSEPYWDDIFTFWDLFRCSTALMHVLQPAAYEEQIRSLVDIWRHEGFMPDARSSNFNGRTQGGSNADNVLADAYVKGVRGAVNWTDAYAAMRTDAETTPPPNHDPSAPDSSTKQGRGALPDWLKYGYITPTFSRAVSRAVEYSVNDFGLSQVAKGLGLSSDEDKYLNRSRNWRNHWNPKQESLGFKGFVVPRYANGSFEQPYDPLQCGGCYWGDPYYEGLPWEYSFNAHHDISTLIEYSGGAASFVNKLETLFRPGVTGPGSTIFNPANEPSFTSPYLFNFAGRQDLSVKHSRSVGVSSYGIGTKGLPGNSDAGAMQTWILWQMIGLYPMTGQTTFLIGSPWFDDLKIDLGGGKTLEITSSGGDLTRAIYVQSLKVNGKVWDQSWVIWEDVFANGGKMEFVLGPEPRQWATGALPPSPAS